MYLGAVIGLSKRTVGFGILLLMMGHIITVPPSELHHYLVYWIYCNCLTVHSTSMKSRDLFIASDEIYTELSVLNRHYWLPSWNTLQSLHNSRHRALFDNSTVASNLRIYVKFCFRGCEFYVCMKLSESCKIFSHREECQSVFCALEQSIVQFLVILQSSPNSSIG